MFSLLELFESKNAAELVTSIKELHYPPLILTVCLILCLWLPQFLILHVTFTHPSALKVV